MDLNIRSYRTETSASLVFCMISHVRKHTFLEMSSSLATGLAVTGVDIVVRCKEWVITDR
jgi:hypothetical protein